MAFSNWFSSPFLRRWILLLWVKIINHGTNKISISIPDHAVAGEIVIEYLESEIDLGLSDEMTESRLVISNRDQEQGKLSINFGYFLLF